MTEHQYASNYRIGIESQIDQLTDLLKQNGHVITGEFKDDFDLCITLAYTAAVFSTTAQMQENPAIAAVISRVCHRVLGKLRIGHEYIPIEEWEAKKNEKKSDAQEKQPATKADPVRDPNEYGQMLKEITKRQLDILFVSMIGKGELSPEDNITKLRSMFALGFYVGLLNGSSQILSNMVDARLIQQVCANFISELGLVVEYGDALQAPTIPKRN